MLTWKEFQFTSLEAIIMIYVSTGVTKQMEAFREGFESVFPLANLKIFYPEELEQVFCGSPSGKTFITNFNNIKTCCINTC